MANFSFSLIAPTKSLFKGECVSVTVPTTEGFLTLLSGHTPLIAEVKPGELTLLDTQHITHHIHVAGGSLHIDLEHNVTLLADSAEHYYEIDIERAEKAKQRAEKLLKNHKSLTGREVAFAKNLLEKNLQRISIARKHAHRRRSPITSEGVLEE